LIPDRLRSSPRATYALIGLMAAAFVASVILGGSRDPSVLFRLGAQDAESVWEGEWWRLLTSIFLHAGPVHLLFNGVSLYVLGQALEPPLGVRRFLLLFFVSGVTASLATLVFVRDVLSVGASGAVFGLAGFLLADELTQRRLYRRVKLVGGPRWRPRVSIIPMLLLNLALGVAIREINNYAHVGGLVAGFLLGTAWIEAHLRKPVRSAAAALALGVLIGGLALAGFRPAFTWVPAFREATVASAAGEWERAYAAFTRAIESGGDRRAHLFAQRAFAAVKAGRYEEALADANRALALDPENASFRYLRATIYSLRGDRAAALADARAACEAGVEEACSAIPR
jgi:rhomboid protease GluP